MLIDFVKKNVSLFKQSSWKIILGLAVCGFLFFGQTAQSERTPLPLKQEKKNLSWLRLSQMTKPRTVESFAKKEQIEKDLLTFQPISHATVALSLPEEEDNLLQQVSVILTLHEGEELSGSIVHAIIDYLSGCLPGIDRNHITLSDNLGNVYAPANNTSPSLLITTITTHLARLLPKEHFIVNNIPSTEQPQIYLTLNETYLNTLPQPKTQQLVTHVENYLAHVCPHQQSPMVEILPFTKTANKSPIWSKSLTSLTILLVSLVIVAGACCCLAFHAYEHMPQGEYKIKRGINMTKLVELLQKEPPEKIALILSYLDSTKAEELLNRLPEDTRSQILKLQ